MSWGRVLPSGIVTSERKVSRMVGMTLVNRATKLLWEMMDTSLGISSATRRIRRAVIWEVLPRARPATANSLFGSTMFTRAWTLFW